MSRPISLYSIFSISLLSLYSPFAFCGPLANQASCSTPSPAHDLVMVDLVTPDGVSFMVAVGTENKATYVNRDLGVRLIFRQVQEQSSRSQPMLGVWRAQEEAGTLESESLLQTVPVGSAFSLAEIPGLQGVTRWVIPGEWAESKPVPLSNRMIRFRIRHLDEDWVYLTALEGELARFTDSTERGLGIVPIMTPSGDVTVHLYTLEAGKGCEPERLEFVTVESAAIFVPINAEAHDQIFELEILETIASLSQGPLPIDTSQCWSWNCGASGNQRAHGHACVVECGGNCCAVDPCLC